MASANKPTAVHFSLIFFVMWSLIASVVAYMYFDEYSEASNKERTAATNLQKEQSARRTADEEIQELKKLIGNQLAQVGIDQRDNETTVIGKTLSDLQTYAGPLVQPTVVDTLKKLREEMDNLTRERNALQADLADHKQRILAIQGNAETRVTQFQDATRKAEADLQDRVTTSEEAIASKQKEVDALRTEMAQLNVEKQNLEERLVRLTEEKNKQIANLESINNLLRDKFEQSMNVSFEKPDGQLTWVDNVNGLVWINLGSADKLQKGTTFSVYTKGYEAIARGSEDIKGAIEVTRVLGAHMAEARVTDEDLYQPMSKGDPIYTPLWSAGRTEQFALVGFVDLDGDKQSDRALLHEIVRASGAAITNEIDDQGNRTGDGIDVETKYLVVADLPDPSEVTGKERDAADKVLAEYKELESQARQHAVRKISLNDFLAHIGYKPTQRNWRPGEQIPWTLRSGSQSTGVNETSINRSSTGNVSGQFQGNRRLGPKTSTGNSSGLYRSGR